MPVDVIEVNKHTRSRVSPHRLLSLLKGASNAFALVEQPEYRPMKRHNSQTGILENTSIGVVKAAAFAEGYGVLLCALIASGCSIQEIRAGEWKKKMRLTGNKDDSLRMAANMFPAFARSFARKKDDGRAEAALIGYWATRIGSNEISFRS